MPGFNSIRSLVDREVTDGATVYTGWRKLPSVATAAGFWQDLSMAPGNPRPNYYASSPQIAARLAQSTDGGIYHGGAVSPSTKHLRILTALTAAAGAVPLPMTLCDYLLYYPFLDESIIDEEQVMDNTVGLSRYTNGAGVRIMAVVVAGHTVGTGTFFTVNYTNQAGVAGRTTLPAQLGTQFVNGTIATSARATASCFAPFLPLQAGDTGVRSVEGITFTGIPDVGLVTLVLVKPLADISLRGIDAPVEVDFLIDRPSSPRIVDDAYLNFIALAGGSLSAAQIMGDATFTWSS
jgi:hypothetical protein